jgi:hypothetical protein
MHANSLPCYRSLVRALLSSDTDFADLHINQMMVEAWQNSHFPMLIVHPQGKDILRMVNRTLGRPLYCPEPLEEITTYDSTRALSEIFGGNDPAEHARILDFLGG